MNSFFENLNNTQRILVTAIMAVVLYAVTTGVSYSIFAGMKGALSPSSSNVATAVPTPGSEVEEDPKAPKTEECPLNGGMHSKATRDTWEGRRPLAVMIENHLEARPQSGLTSANLVYEAVAEGGITRFMAVFYCLPVNAANQVSDVLVGPVRSARTYFLDWLSEYDALYAHVGGANTPGPANALGQIIDYKIKDLNQFSIGFPTFWRDYQRLGHPVATEHTMYSSTQKLFDIAAKKGWTATDSANFGARWDKGFEKWKFKDEQPGGNVSKISVSFWASQGDYSVEWNYDGSCNCYKRKNGGNDHTDLNNSKQIQPKTVIVRMMAESHANDGYENNVHLLYANKGPQAPKGEAYIFMDGKAIKGEWRKTNRLAREKFYDDKGQEVLLNRGQIWLEAVPIGSSVTY